MKKEELLKVYACAEALWSSFKIPKSDIEARIFDNVWFSCLKTYDTNVVLVALREYARENDFCNIAKVSDLCEKFTQMANGTWIDVEKVLTEIRRAISGGGDYKERFAKLSPFAQQIVEHPGFLGKWAMTVSSDVDTVIMSNLRKKIQNVLSRNRDEKVVNKLIEIGDADEKKYLTD